jgi:hypothetical protein
LRSAWRYAGRSPTITATTPSDSTITAAAVGRSEPAGTSLSAAAPPMYASGASTPRISAPACARRHAGSGACICARPGLDSACLSMRSPAASATIGASAGPASTIADTASAHAGAANRQRVEPNRASSRPVITSGAITVTSPVTA